jgi:dolichol kinase
MQEALDESGRLVMELHRALSDIDRARWHGGAADAVRSKLAAIQARLGRLTSATWADEDAPLRGKLAELGRTLAAQVPSEDGTASSAWPRWQAFRRALTPTYEALQATLREHEIHVPTLRPSNTKRALLHVTTALIGVVVLRAAPGPWWPAAIAVPLALAGWTTEALRRGHPRINALVMRVFAPVAHAHEYRRVNSATWYVTALALLSLTRAPLPCAVGLAALGLGDPAAALVGRRFGRIRLMHGRSLEGSAAFFGVATLAGAAVAWAFAPTLPLAPLLSVAAAAALAGAVTELVSLRVDDNLSVALAASAAAALTAHLLGVPTG